MSYIFDVNGETVWSPSLQVGRLYVSMARCLAEGVHASSGLIANSEDMYDLDPETFPHLVRQVARSDTSKHPVYHSLTKGFVGTSLVMLERGGIGDDVLSAIADRFAADTAVLRKSMPK